MRSLVMLGSLAFLSFALSACSGKASEDPPEPEPEPPPEVIDTGWPPGDIANIHLAYHANQGKMDVYAVFAESAPTSIINLAQCTITGGTCLGAISQDEDEYEEFDPDQDLDQDGIITRFAGYELKVGPYRLPYREDAQSKFGSYYSDGTEVDDPPFGKTIGVSWGGQWQPYEGTDDLYVPAPIELLSPTMDSHIYFTNDKILPLEWVPTGEGFVTLAVTTRFTLARLYLLEDDGYFPLDVDDLGLLSDSDDLTFTFIRWNQATLHKFGHVIELLSTSDASFTGTYIQIGNRLPVYPADECIDARGSLPLEAGGWWGYLGGGLNNDDSPSCVGFYPSGAQGPDGIFRIDVGSHHIISADYNLLDASASVYFVGDCSEVNSTCIVGRDQFPDPNVHEYVQVFNADDETKTVFLVIDATSWGDSSVFTLDITDEALLPPPMYDTCAQAQAPTATPLTPGNYYADFLAYTDGLNPGTGGCTTSSLNGADSLVPISVGPNQTLNVTIDMPGGDPGIYLLYNCLDEFSCPAGSDVGGVGASEAITYTNYSAGTETLYLVIDSKGVGLRPYFLGITVQ